MNSFLYIFTAVSVGLMVGSELAVSAFIDPVLWKLEEPPRAQVVSYFAGRLGKAMPFWYILNLLLLLANAFTFRGHAGARLIVSAVVIWSAVIVLTLTFLVPINNRLARGSLSNHDEAHRQHKRWDIMHRVRVAALAAAMVLFLLADHCS